ncbi:MAG: hypothetical protein RL681_751 [Candidatus Parcubacteria bacterium]|jgi:hypothetical protein
MIFRPHLGKKTKIATIAILTLLLLFGSLWLMDFSRADHILGLTFSDRYVEEFGMDPRETLTAILSDMRPKKLRLVAYWDRLEPQSGATDFSSLDWQIATAEASNVPVVLAVGFRTPRWPECHIPDWAAELPDAEQHEMLFRHIRSIVEHYRNSSIISMWQVENEPLLGVFGKCPPPDREFLKKEIAFVKELDPSRPVLTTASGELSFWTRTAGLSEVFGTTLYRYIWNERVGNFTHIFPPAWYTIRAWFATHVLGAHDVIIAELQAEPWGEGAPLTHTDFTGQTKAFGTAELADIVGFAKRTGIRELWLWGPEWWYWRKVNGDPSFWDAGRNIFAGH